MLSVTVHGQAASDGVPCGGDRSSRSTEPDAAASHQQDHRSPRRRPPPARSSPGRRTASLSLLDEDEDEQDLPCSGAVTSTTSATHCQAASHRDGDGDSSRRQTVCGFSSDRPPVAVAWRAGSSAAAPAAGAAWRAAAEPVAEGGGGGGDIGGTCIPAEAAHCEVVCSRPLSIILEDWEAERQHLAAQAERSEARGGVAPDQRAVPAEHGRPASASASASVQSSGYVPPSPSMAGQPACAAAPAAAAAASAAAAAAVAQPFRQVSWSDSCASGCSSRRSSGYDGSSVSSGACSSSSTGRTSSGCSRRSSRPARRGQGMDDGRSGSCSPTCGAEPLTPPFSRPSAGPLDTSAEEAQTGRDGGATGAARHRFGRGVSSPGRRLFGAALPALLSNALLAATERLRHRLLTHSPCGTDEDSSATRARAKDWASLSAPAGAAPPQGEGVANERGLQGGAGGARAAATATGAYGSQQPSPGGGGSRAVPMPPAAAVAGVGAGVGVGVGVSAGGTEVAPRGGVLGQLGNVACFRTDGDAEGGPAGPMRVQSHDPSTGGPARSQGGGALALAARSHSEGGTVPGLASGPGLGLSRAAVSPAVTLRAKMPPRLDRGHVSSRGAAVGPTPRQPSPPLPSLPPSPPLPPPPPALVAMLRRSGVPRRDLLLCSEALALGAQLGALMGRAAARGEVSGGEARGQAAPLFQRAMAAARAVSHHPLRAMAQEVVWRYADPRRGNVEEAISRLLEVACKGPL